MDQDRFDRIVRALAAGATRRAGLRAALGGLLGVGLGAGAAALDADARREGKDRGKARGRAGSAGRKHDCGPDTPCPTGFDCEKQARKRRCVCSTGVVCDGACCPTGQACRNGACVAPAACVAPGEPCKGVGLPCCDGRVCASGQGGQDDIACYAPKTGACRSTADCVYGTACFDGRCALDVPPPAALGAPCNASVGQQCADPGAVCTSYDGPGAPSGAYCTLPLNRACSGDPDCTCHTCRYENPAAAGGTSRAGQGRTLPTHLACCGPEGYACASDRNCCLGTRCVNGVCQAACTVCKDGDCPYTSIADAYAALPAASVISIAPGVYSEPQVELSRDVDFVRCGTSGTVVWQNAVRYDKLVVTPSNGPASVGFAFLDFRQNPGPNLEAGDQLMAFGDGAADRRLKVTAIGCVWRDYTPDPNYGGYGAISAAKFTDLVFSGCAFRDIDARDTGIGAGIQSNGDLVTPNTLLLDRCAFERITSDQASALHLTNTATTAVSTTFTANEAIRLAGAIYCTGNASSLVLRDCTLSGNTAGAGNGQNYGGGAVYVVGGLLSLTGTTGITGNASGTGEPSSASAIRAKMQTGWMPVAARITGTTPSRVYGNAPAPQCQIVSQPGNAATFRSFDVTCDGWCVPSGGACDVTLAPCCSGTCCSGTCSVTCP